ncbi:outer membrane beta-barrel protein [Persicobacter sp. CCB-QB2]|uniref:outer membrane beta-barrel protein n=1 Tax=Persicobacter sp. CCB-QB2 TaxID=1561025 RepID=UPI0012F9E9D5|nr:outer membrane beta-barrel protein [Persicobacter sp. CCB-QB2]
MKRLALFIVLILAGLNDIYAQERHQVGLEIGYHNAAYIKSSSMDGGGSTNGKDGFGLQLNYSYYLSPEIALKSGLMYHRSIGESAPEFMPDRDMTPNAFHQEFLSIPLMFHHEVSPFFFYEAGLLFDKDLNTPFWKSMSGVGAGLALGLQLPLEKLLLSLQPFVNVHGLMLTGNGTGRQLLINSGFRIGAAYRF